MSGLQSTRGVPAWLGQCGWLFYKDSNRPYVFAQTPSAVVLQELSLRKTNSHWTQRRLNSSREKSSDNQDAIPVKQRRVDMQKAVEKVQICVTAWSGLCVYLCARSPRLYF